MSTGKRIAEARKAAGMSQTDLARAAGVSQGTVWKLEHDQVSESAKLIPVAKALGLPVEVFTEGAPAPIRAFEIKTDEDAPEDGDVTVEVPDIELSAGDGADAPEFVETRYRHTYRAEFLRANGVRDPATIRRCRVRGDSMERVLFDGDMVTINTADKRVVDDAVYALLVADQLKVKRLRRRRDGGLQIISDNPRYPVEDVPADEVDTVRIIGRVFDRSGRGGL